MRNPGRTTAIVATLAALTALGCEAVQAPESPEEVRAAESAPLRLVLTDAPFPYDSVARVDLHVVRVEVAAAAGGPGAGAPWITVAEPRRAFDLLSLQNGVTSLLGEARVRPGWYGAVRLVIDTDSSSLTSVAGHPVAVDWRRFRGQVALDGQVESPIEVREGGASAVIDFDVGRSFLCPNEACTGPLQFVPGFRAVDQGTTGAIAGAVRGDTLRADGPPLAGAPVTVFRGDPTLPEASWTVVATGRTDSGGRYVVAFLHPGTYILRADAPRSAPWSTGFRTDVRVAAGQRSEAQDVRLPPGTRAALLLRAVTGSLYVGDSAFVQLANAPPPGPGGAASAVAWQSSDPKVVTLGYRGQGGAQAHAVGPGTATITASHEGRSGSVRFTVASRPGLIALRLNPAASTISVRDSVMFQALVVDGAGRALNPESIHWAVSDTTVARFSRAERSFGNLQGRAPGAVTVAVSVGDLRATAEVSVRPRPVVPELRLVPAAQSQAVGRDVFLQMLVADSVGYRPPASPVVWTIKDTSVVAFPFHQPTGSSAMMRAVAPGTTTVTATVDGTARTSTVTVYPGP